MFRALTLAMLVALLSGVASGQEPGVLRIKVTLTDAAHASVPIPRAALLISDNPATITPRRVVTKADGTAEISLRPGSYTVESDEPVAFDGKGYQWTQTLDVKAGRDVTLELTAANAEVGPAPAPSSSPASSFAATESAAALLLTQWKDSVVAIWTPESRASGFIVDTKGPAGIVVTNQRVVGNATAVEVQLTPSLKVAARVLATDRERDVAVLWIDPAIAASVRPIPMNCTDASTRPIADGERLAALGAPLRGEKEASTDLRLASGSVGGPIFSTGGGLIGLSSVVEDEDERRRRDARIVPFADACEVMKSAEKALPAAPRPVATHLPVEPLRPFPADALDAEAKRRLGSLSPYELSASGFDVAFLTPVMIRGAQNNPQQANARSQPVQLGPSKVVPTDFGDWSEYFADVPPPVLVVRVTPKLTEGFWTKFARGAAYTQGMALPPIKHFAPGFLRMRVMCGDAEVTPIHPFLLTQRVSETDAVHEGLYVFDPQALGPQCKSVTLTMYSEKDPQKPDTRAVDPKIIERISQDFAR
jgi:trypsin-like peptidase